LIEVGVGAEYGPGSAGFVENCGWDDVVGEFEGIFGGCLMRISFKVEDHTIIDGRTGVKR
jgi:hypothetical protein